MKNFIFCLFILPFLANAQTTKTATVQAVFHLGMYDYTILETNQTSEVYKTSLYLAASNVMVYNQNVNLVIDNLNPEQASFQSPANEQIFCFLQTSTSNTFQLSAITDLPVVVNGILMFRDKAHYDNISSALHEAEEGNIDENLDGFENLFLNFESYRTWFNVEYDYLDGAFTFEELDYLSNLEFVNDEVIKTLLSADRFVGIGDSIFQYQDENVVLSFKKDNEDALQFLMNPAFKDLTDFVTPASLNGLEILVDGELEYFELYDPNSVTKALVIVVEDSLRYISYPITNNVNCSVEQKLLKVIVDEGIYNDTIYNYDYTSYTIDWVDNFYSLYGTNATLTIDWKDGSPIQTINNYTGQYISHSYPSGSLGTNYYPTTKLEFDDTKGNVQTLEDGNGTPGQYISFLVELACTDAGKAIVVWKSSGNWYIKTKLWVVHNWLGHQIGSYSHSFEMQSGKLESIKSKMHTAVNGVFRDNNCLQVSTKSGNKTRKKVKKVQKTKNKLFKYYDISNGDIKSSHYMIKGSLTLSLNNELNPC